VRAGTGEAKAIGARPDRGVAEPSQLAPAASQEESTPTAYPLTR
jgi:hypothetical protein